MAAQTKSELVEELAAHVTKDDLVKVLGSKLKKDELADVVDDNGDATKEQLVRKLGSRTKDALVQALEARLTKEEIQKLVASHAPKEEDSGPTEQTRERRPEPETDEQLDWSAELEWAPPPRPTPAPVAYVGAAPFMPGQRVRVDLAGLPMLGVFAGKGASAEGTIVGVDARERAVRVFLDAVFDGEKELVLPPERITPDG